MRGLALALVLVAGPVWAEPLEGAFRGVFNDLTLSVTDGKAVAEVPRAPVWATSRAG